MIGIFSKTTDSNLVEAAAFSGLDFMIFDQEHGPIDLVTLHNHVRSAQLTAMKSIVRVQVNSPNHIASALDSGADGIQIPNISSLKEAENAINSARFYPKGNRGVCRFVKGAKFGTIDKEQYFNDANKKLLILQVEGKKGLSNIDDILDLNDFDILFIGPYDLSQSLGYPGDINHPKVLNAISKISIKAKKKNKILGTFVDDMETAIKYKKEGFQYIACSVDLSIFLQALCKIKKDFENE